MISWGNKRNRGFKGCPPKGPPLGEISPSVDETSPKDSFGGEGWQGKTGQIEELLKGSGVVGFSW